MTSTTVRNFSLLNVTGTTVTATNISQRIPIASDKEDIMVVNNTTAVIFVRTGIDSVVADASAMPILQGEKAVYRKGTTAGTTEFLAYFVESGIADLTVLQGQGG